MQAYGDSFLIEYVLGCSGYNRRSLVETAVYRYKTIIGRRLQARTMLKQRTEAKIGWNVVNRMPSLAMPASVRLR